MRVEREMAVSDRYLIRRALAGGCGWIKSRMKQDTGTCSVKDEEDKAGSGGEGKRRGKQTKEQEQ